MKLVKLVVFCFAFSLILSSCASKNEEARYTGIRANEDVVSSIRQDIKDKENSLLANENDVFWTESGKLWHKSPDCSYLANSKTVLHGTIEEAKLEGKEKGCERCTDANIDAVYNSLENNQYHAGDVFFTRDGDCWHSDINCSEILGAKKIYFADEDTAKFLGKLTPCDKCEN